MQGVFLTFFCPMRFRWYPLDSHDCYLRFGSSMSSSKEKLTEINLKYNPDETNVILEHNVQMRALTEEENMSFNFSGSLTRSVSGIKISLAR